MALSPGTRLGVYEILSLLGVGGMGEVYRARDTKLNRDVAIKVLLASVADDPDRLARFSREAQVLASLNHPNIAHVHGFEDAAGVHALVMELVEGPTLADQIGHGALPVDEALPIARQIAEALEAAHDLGIIHRDLKPANIKVRADGTVKVLDFGLAKALDPAGASSADATISPTLSLYATAKGVILGTAAYMSPEQARGKVVDARTDIWAFGCVLFEMLTGKRAFRGDDVTDTIVAVVSKEPDWQALATAASSLRPLLTRCLRKDPKQRLQAIGDARLHIDELISGTSEALTWPGATPTLPARVAPRLLAALAGVAVVTALVMWALMRSAPPDRAPTARFEVVPPVGQSLPSHGYFRRLAISPNGQHIVYQSGPRNELVVRAIDRLEARGLEGTANALNPFFSPDGQWIGFFADLMLKKVSISGGPVIPICPSEAPRGASWGEDGNIVFATQDTASGLLRVGASGGTPTTLTTPDAAKGERDHLHLSLLPKGRGVLFTIVYSDATVSPRVAVLDLTTGQQKTLIRGGTQPEYLPTGHLVYAVGDTLSAVRFNLAQLDVIGDPVTLVDGVTSLALGPTAAADYAISERGTLVYIPAEDTDPPKSLIWVDRAGRETPISAPPSMYQAPRLSPDGMHIAVAIGDQQRDIQVLDLRRGTFMRLAPSAGTLDSTPIWTSDGKRIVFSSQRGGSGNNLYEVAADGSGTVKRLTSGPTIHIAAWVAPDGSGILGSEVNPKTAGNIVWFPFRRPASPAASPPSESGSDPEPLVATPFIDYNPAVSPDGRYVAYQSNESGQDEIYVRPRQMNDGGLWPVSNNGGRMPAWARDGRELYYLDLTGALTAVPVESPAGKLVVGNPSKLFMIPSFGQTAPRPYDPAPDGRFLVVKATGSVDRKPPSMVVVLNWFDELQAKFQGSRVR